jgi:hypothetical protein
MLNLDTHTEFMARNLHTRDVTMQMEGLHRINNPLQSLMQVAYLAAEGQSNYSAKTLGQEFSVDLRRFSALVTESLTHPPAGRS